MAYMAPWPICSCHCCHRQTESYCNVSPYPNNKENYCVGCKARLNQVSSSQPQQQHYCPVVTTQFIPPCYCNNHLGPVAYMPPLPPPLPPPQPPPDMPMDISKEPCNSSNEIKTEIKEEVILLTSTAPPPPPSTPPPSTSSDENHAPKILENIQITSPIAELDASFPPENDEDCIDALKSESKDDFYDTLQEADNTSVVSAESEEWAREVNSEIRLISSISKCVQKIIDKIPPKSKCKGNMKAKILKNCRYCEKDHPLKKCFRFCKMNIERRWDVVKKFNYCSNCLAYSHATEECTSQQRCKKCNGKHHRLLHDDSGKEHAMECKRDVKKSEDAEQEEITNMQANDEMNTTKEKPDAIEVIELEEDESDYYYIPLPEDVIVIDDDEVQPDLF